MLCSTGSLRACRGGFIWHFGAWGSVLGMQREGPGWVGDSSDFFCQQRGKGWSLLLNSVVIPDSLCLVSCKGLRVGEGGGWELGS